MHRKFELSSLLHTIFAFSRVPYYTYQPLTAPHDAIRLILLQPDPHLKSPIRCNVIETFLSAETPPPQKDQQDYVELSYTWCNALPRCQMAIDGQPFEVTTNLDLALRHLRLPRKDLRLWADSLCLYLDRHQTKYRGN